MSAMIFRLIEADTNRLASGDSLVNRPTRARWARGLAEAVLFAGFATDLVAVFAALLGASGVTVAGAFGSPFTAVFFAGPGRFNLALEGLKQSWHHSVNVSTAHCHDEVAIFR